MKAPDTLRATAAVRGAVVGQQSRPVNYGDGAALRRLLLNGLAVVWLVTVWSAAAGSVRHAAYAGQADFFTLLDSAEQLRRGASIYTPIRSVNGALVHPNLNHPIVTVLLLPLTALARHDAFLLWTALGSAGYLLALALAVRATGPPLGRAYLPATFALALTLPGTIYALQLGQFGLQLALPVVGVWLLLRRDRMVAAGALLGVLVALKPFLFIVLLAFLVRRWWPGSVAAAGAMLALSLATLPWTGPGAYGAWLLALRQVNWYNHGLNISLTGLLYRTVQPSPPTIVTGIVTAAAAIVGLLLIWRAPLPGLRRADRDVAVLLALAILGSPLGWLYYTPLLMPTLFTAGLAWSQLSRARRAVLAIGCLLLWVPHVLLLVLPETLLMELTLRATPTYSVIALAAALAGPRGRGDTTR